MLFGFLHRKRAARSSRVEKCILLMGLENFVACDGNKRPHVMIVESYDWRKCLTTRQSKLSSWQMHLTKGLEILLYVEFATTCPLVRVVKSIFPLVSCRQYWTWLEGKKRWNSRPKLSLYFPDWIALYCCYVAGCKSVFPTWHSILRYIFSYLRTS